jgi:putative tryptophan/tyrosine transport system substrate-binding protein
VIAQSEIPEQAEGWPRGLREHGWIEGQNLQVEYRYFSDQLERIPALAAELAAAKPEVIVAAGPLPARAVQAAAPAVPLVFLAIADPVGLGFIDSLAHPGRNATGIGGLVPEGFDGKQIQLLKELVPQASQIAVLTNPTNPMHQHGKAELPDIERALGVQFLIVEADGIDQVIE